ncbi:MAG: peroxiredoxin-like family protein [Candidatus Competibacteraceae bacterium]|nr:peroxiredoxin-like family protein [Candidatus Competibacteraceae bacterium]
MSHLIPRLPVPSLSLNTVDGQPWILSDRHPENFTLLVFYRGLHCPICKLYLNDLQRRLPDFALRGVEVIAISGDDRQRAQRTREEWELSELTLGYGLTISKAREWGLYISEGIGTNSAGIEEPQRFNEPGLFLVRPDGTLYSASVQTMPFARPNFGELLKALDMILEKDYPARGEACCGR